MHDPLLKARPATGDLIAFCHATTMHECQSACTSVWWSFGIVGDYKKTWTEDAVPVKTLNGTWTATSIGRVMPAMFTFTGPIRRDWCV